MLFGAALLLLAAPLFGAPPTFNSVFPPGGQRGTEVVVTASGEFSAWPVEVWTDRPGIAAKAEAEKGKLRITIDANASPGVYWVRLYNAEGTSARRPFLVEQLPEVEEAEPNDAPEKPQAVATEQVVNGRLGKASDVDAYAVTLRKNDILVASLRAHSIFGSPLDGVLQICELRERRFSSLAGAPAQIEAYVLEQNNDGLGLDPQVSVMAPRDGTYLVRVFAFGAEPSGTIGFAGGDNYLYRLTLSTKGFADHALPSDAKDALTLFGPGLSAQGVPAERVGPIAFTKDVPGYAPAPPSGRLLARDSNPLLLEQITNPVCVTGRLQARGAEHEVRFTATKGQLFDIGVRSRSLGYPIDPVLTIADTDGKVLHQIDDTEKKADPRQAFTAPADGSYSIRVRDLHRRGGLSFVYWLDIAPARPGVALTLAAESFTLARGKTLEIPVTIARKHGHKAPLQITATGVNGAALPAGVSAALVTSENQNETSKAVKLVLTATAEATLGGAPIQIAGREEGSETPVFALAPNPHAFTEAPDGAWLTVVQP